MVKLYAFLARRTESKFNAVVYKRLNQSNVNRYPVSISRLVKYAKTEEKRKQLIVVVAPVLNDERLLVVPKMRVCAFRFTHEARARIEKAGGECLTFDQLAQSNPLGKNTILVRGRRSREALKHFRGLHGDSAKPYILHNNHRARERRFGQVKK